MLVDIHTILFWYPDHLSDEFVETARAAKRAKLQLSPDVCYAGEGTNYSYAFDSRPEQLIEATPHCDKVIVFGIQAPFCLTGHQHHGVRMGSGCREGGIRWGGWPGKGARSGVWQQGGGAVRSVWAAGGR